MVCRHSTVNYFLALVLAVFLAAGFSAAFFAGFMAAAGFLAADFFDTGLFAFFAAVLFIFLASGFFAVFWFVIWFLGGWLLLGDLLGFTIRSLLGFRQFE